LWATTIFREPQLRRSSATILAGLTSQRILKTLTH